MSSFSHTTTSHQPLAGTDCSSTWVPEPELEPGRISRVDTLNAPSTTPSHAESFSAIHSRIRSLVQDPTPFSEHRPPSPISPLHLGPSILSRRVFARDHETPAAPYLPPQYLRSPKVFPTAPREIGFESSRRDNLNGMGQFPGHGCVAGVREPERPRLPPIRHLSELCRTELPVASPNTTPGAPHLPGYRFPPFTLPTEGFNRFRPYTRSHAPSHPPSVPGFERPCFLDTRTMENDLSIRDLVTLAIKRDIPLRSMIIDRLHRVCGSEVPVFPGEVREFEHSFEAPWPGPLRLPTPEASIANPLITPDHRGHELSGPASARNEARAAIRHTGRMKIDFITNQATVDPNDLGYPESTDVTDVHNNGHRNPTRGEDQGEGSSKRSCNGTRRSRGSRKPYIRPLVITRRSEGSSLSDRNEASRHGSRQAGPLLGSDWISHRDDANSPSGTPDATDPGDWMVVGGE